MAIWSFLIKFASDTVGLDMGIKRAQSGIAALGTSARRLANDEMKGIGRSIAAAFTVASVVQFSNHLKETVGHIKDTAELLGISTDEMQRLDKAASNTGNSVKLMVTTMERLESMRASAINGDSRAVGVFKTLGIDPTKGSPLEVLKQVLDASTQGTKEAAAAYDIVGNKALKLKQVMGELKNLGPMELITTEQIDKIDAAFKKLDEAKRRFTVNAAPVYTGIAEGIANITDPSYWQLITSMMAKGFANATGQFYTASLIDETAGGVSLSALPLPTADKKKKSSSNDETLAAVNPMSQDRFDRSGSSLNQGGGFFFDRAPRIDNPIQRSLERVAKASEKTAEILEREVR